MASTTTPCERTLQSNRSRLYRQSCCSRTPRPPKRPGNRMLEAATSAPWKSRHLHVRPRCVPHRDVRNCMHCAFDGAPSKESTRVESTLCVLRALSMLSMLSMLMHVDRVDAPRVLAAGLRSMKATSPTFACQRVRMRRTHVCFFNASVPRKIGAAHIRCNPLNELATCLAS